MKTRLLAVVGSAMLLPFGMQLLAQDQYEQATYGQAAVQRISPDQLDSLVAPVALYADSLLSQVLVASTYPLQLVEANQWLQQNGNLPGPALVAAAQQQNWDPSVQALVAFPDVIRRLTSDIRWTTGLGNAFLAQQADVMNAVQEMRARARDNGRLTDTPQQRVVTEYQDGQTAIAIQPVDPEVVYVPVYNPDYFWGPSPYYPWPGLYYPSAGAGWGWGYGIRIGAFFGGCRDWGWGAGWFNRTVIVNNTFLNRYNFRGYDGYGSGNRGTTVWANSQRYSNGFAGNNLRGAETQRFAQPQRGFQQGGGYQQGFQQGGQIRGNEFRRGGQSYPQNDQRGFGGMRNESRPSVSNERFTRQAPQAQAPQMRAPESRGGGPRGGGGANYHGGRR